MAESRSDEPETTTVNIRLTESFLEDVDVTWKEAGYTSRSEFIRDAVRDAVKHPGVTRGDWKDVAATEFGRRRGKAAVLSRDDVIEDYMGSDDWTWEFDERANRVGGRKLIGTSGKSCAHDRRDWGWDGAVASGPAPSPNRWRGTLRGNHLTL